MTLFDLAQRVRNGVRLLDKKIPNWRTILRKHEGSFDFSNGDCCILGTLEHHSGRMRVLRKRRRVTDRLAFTRGYQCLGLESADVEAHGFDADATDCYSYVDQKDLEVLSDLWRAEFSK